jgi:pyrroloquinoline quinone biosynthesis protein B
VEKEGPRAWLLDASPDLPEQLELIREALGATDKSGIPLSAILLTHGHMGHVWGLGYLGKEGMMPRNLPVFAPPGVVRYLRENRPFKDLIEHGAVDLRSIRPGDEVPFAQGLKATPLAVPHRTDVSDTVGWLFEGLKNNLLYAPDMDVLDDVMVDVIASVDIAIIDGTFYSRDEIPGAMTMVPHPPVERSMELLQGAVRKGTRVIFTHLNHTNPLCDPTSTAMEDLLQRGYEVAADGMTLEV